MLEALKRLFLGRQALPAFEWELRRWDEFETHDGHSMRRVGRCEWVCKNCGSVTTYAHGMSPCPDDWPTRSSVDGKPFRECWEEMTLAVLGS